jgi:hypothetical protein
MLFKPAAVGTPRTIGSPWNPVPPTQVVEVRYDHFSGQCFRPDIYVSRFQFVSGISVDLIAIRRVTG